MNSPIEFSVKKTKHFKWKIFNYHELIPATLHRSIFISICGLLLFIIHIYNAEILLLARRGLGALDEAVVEEKVEAVQAKPEQAAGQ